MSHHVLLEDDDELEQTFSDTNPFAPQNTNAGQEDWRSKFGAFARRAGETVKQHAAKAAATAQVKIAEAKGMALYIVDWVAMQLSKCPFAPYILYCEAIAREYRDF